MRYYDKILYYTTHKEFERHGYLGKPETRKALMQAERDEKIAEAKKRQEEAETRIAAAKGKK